MVHRKSLGKGCVNKQNHGERSDVRGYKCPHNLSEEIWVLKSMLFSAKASLGQRLCLRHGFQLWHSCVSVLRAGQRQKREKSTGSDLAYGCLGSGFILLLCPHHYEAIHGIARELIVRNILFLYFYLMFVVCERVIPEDLPCQMGNGPAIIKGRC